MIPLTGHPSYEATFSLQNRVALYKERDYSILLILAHLHEMELKHTKFQNSRLQIFSTQISQTQTDL